MQKIELSSPPAVSITGGGGGGGVQKQTSAIHYGTHVASGRRGGSLLLTARLCGESLIIVKCQCEISNQHETAALQETQNPNAQVSHMNFTRNFN